MKLEIGKRYWRRDDMLSGVIRPNDSPEYPFQDGEESYAENGEWLFGETSDLDLIAEYHEPVSASPVPHEPASANPIPHKTLARLASMHGIRIAATYGDEHYEYGG